MIAVGIDLEGRLAIRAYAARAANALQDLLIGQCRHVSLEGEGIRYTTGAAGDNMEKSARSLLRLLLACQLPPHLVFSRSTLRNRLR